MIVISSKSCFVQKIILFGFPATRWAIAGYRHSVSGPLRTRRDAVSTAAAKRGHARKPSLSIGGFDYTFTN